MALSQASLLARTRTQLARERSARAQGAPLRGATHARFAAVMGSAIRAELDESEEWQVSAHLDSDDQIRYWKEKAARAMAADGAGHGRNPLDGLFKAVERSVVGVLWQAKDNLLSSLSNLASSPPISSNSDDVSAETDSGSGSRRSCGSNESEREAKATDALLTELEGFLNAKSAGKSASRMVVQTRYE
jgi:hypothetical protein